MSISEFIHIRNFATKVIFFLVACALLAAVCYPHILEKFYLSDRKADDWDSTDTILTSLSLCLFGGGAYLNRLKDTGLKILEKFK